MFLSFIVPVFNADEYLEECLFSLIYQDISHDNFEIICIDDGSTDDSIKILRKFESEYKNVIVFLQKNSGVSSARNRGIKEAKGDYVWFVDSDDFISHNILKSLEGIACDSDSDRITIGSYSFMNKLTPDEQKRFLQNSLVANVPYKLVMATRTLYKRTYLLDNDIEFIEGVHYGEDGVFNYQTLIHNPLTVDSNILGYFYRVHDASVTNIDEQIRAKKSLSGTNAVFNVLVEDYNKKVCVKETRRMLLYWMYATIKNYVFLDEEYFCDTFVWDHNLANVPMFDFELRSFNNFLRKLSKSRNYKKLVSFHQKKVRRAAYQEKKRLQMKKVKSYLKHPKRLLRVWFELKK